ncbi:hypothetical protein BUALT_Bualt02G0094000 [Buddleja alternifolia]|uniref:BHLH domain-containing protein n=1 Tax=Buddleja alternifolia TaxID=168488 RepID=A0AAV6XYU6_9LAMI|nr:hypothetical protein BUALT_Bualt02G0094000 [Buddleja alternifolia]
MAAFSSFDQHHLDSSIFHLPNSPSFFPQFYRPDETLAADHHHQNLDHSTKVIINNEAAGSSSSIVTHKYFDHHSSTDKVITTPIETKNRKSKHPSSANCAQSKVRRERISERMKLLQALVPGCEKVTGKALMLDEIINYVQSLQNQVEFLSMKLASVNPMLYDFGMDLESFMVRPDQQCSPTATNNYALLDNSPNSLMFQQAQIPNTLPQTVRNLIEQRIYANKAFAPSKPVVVKI